jgi:hypothetical protein
VNWTVTFLILSVLLVLLGAAVALRVRSGVLWPWSKSPPFRSARVEELPDKLQKAIIYLAGEGENLWAAAMICPCGCGEVIELNLLKQARPCWSAVEHSDGTVTLAPSVWRQKGCRSHFIVRHGEIVWC